MNFDQPLRLDERWICKSFVCIDRSIHFCIAVEDAKLYLDLKKQKEEHRIVDVSSKPCDNKECPLDEDYELLTHDDAIRRQKGLPPQRYHAYILYDESDFNLAIEILTKMEEYGLKVIN